MSEAEIASQVAEGLQNGTLYYMTDAEGKLCGMILAKIEGNVLFVTENLSMSLKNLREFAKKAQIEFPQFKLEAMRHNKHRKFNTELIYNKLLCQDKPLQTQEQPLRS